MKNIAFYKISLEMGDIPLSFFDGYRKGYLYRYVRKGQMGDDFVRCMETWVIQSMKVPRLLAPKVRRKNTISNRKLNRMFK